MIDEQMEKWINRQTNKQLPNLYKDILHDFFKVFYVNKIHLIQESRMI